MNPVDQVCQIPGALPGGRGCWLSGSREPARYCGWYAGTGRLLRVLCQRICFARSRNHSRVLGNHRVRLFGSLWPFVTAVIPDGVRVRLALLGEGV